MDQMLVPAPWQGLAVECHGEMHWLRDLPVSTYCSLWRDWSQQDDLPQGYELYVISYHLESIDIEWVIRQCNLSHSPIILLSDVNYYDFPCPSNLFCYTYIYWHKQLEQMQLWFPNSVGKNITHKTSAVCNRISLSKLLIFTVLAEHLKDDALLVLGNWLDHEVNKDACGSPLLDHIASIFWSRYYGQEIRIDNFDSSMNRQIVTGNPWTPVYQNASLHFTNESYHFSYMQQQSGNYIRPGPFLTEKTFKCLLGATAFISVGQFDTYDTLERLGFTFDYGLDLSFDRDSGNITRLESIVKLILDLDRFDAFELFEMTRSSCLSNQELIRSGKFAQTCENANWLVKNAILEKFRS